MSVNLIKIPSQSGYTSCACRDCMDITVSSDMTKPELCSECEDAGCVAIAPYNERVQFCTAYECQRDDAYDQECTCDHLRAQYDPAYRQCRFCQSLSA